jgi:GNAT superfamily N-acetyltransferase
MSGYVTRDFRESDKDQIIGLLQSAFDPNMTREYWEWLYPRNPNGYYIAVTELNSEIVGNDGFIPLSMKIGKQEVLGVFNASLVVHPKHRGKGIFLKMGTYATTQLAKAERFVCVGFPNESAHPGHLKYGWFTVSSMPKLVKFLNGKCLMKTKKMQTVLKKYHLLKLQSVFQPMFSLLLMLYLLRAKLKFRVKRTRKKYEVTVRPTPFPKGIDDLWLKVKNNYEILTVRNKEYLNWRFHDCPDREYIVLLGRNSEGFVGYLVAAQENELGLVLDVFGEPNSSIFDALIRKATDLLKSRGVEKIIARITSNNEAYRAFRHNGWFVQESIPIIARVNTLRKTLDTETLKAYLSDSTNWFMTASDNL